MSETSSKFPDAFWAYQRLEAAIVTLRLRPDSMTTEKQLIELAGYGRTPVREAIQRLAWEGFLLVHPRLGLSVAPLHAPDWLKVLETRRGIEDVLIRSAARHVSQSASRAFLRASEAMYAAAAADDALSFLAADKEWDEAIAAVSDNDFAIRLASPLQTHSRRFWYRFRRGEGLGQAANRHIAIIEAVLRRDPDAASAAMTRLIDMLSDDAVHVSAERENAA